MHPSVFEEFDRLCCALGARGDVLEVGAIPSAKSLLCLPSLRQRATRKLGLNLVGNVRFRDFEIVAGNANGMPFADESFDTVLCNAVFEHDPFFWRSLGEIRRVLRPGGLVVIGVPGFDESVVGERLRRILASIPGMYRYANAFANSTLTYKVHNEPGDFYRFSPQACRDVLLESYEVLSVQAMMSPPRIISAGRKPADRAEARVAD